LELNPSFALSHLDHLKTRADFDRVIRAGRHIHRKGMRLSLGDGTSERSRIGFIVGKRVGPAPKRHHWRRLWKEAFRLERHRFSATIDLVVQVRPHCPAMSLNEMRDLLLEHLLPEPLPEDAATGEHTSAGHGPTFSHDRADANAGI
jgi:ribonuclease P protein component